MPHLPAGITRRAALALSAAALLAAPLVTPAAFAADYPTRPVKLVVPWAPGGATDVIARVIGQHLGQRLGQSVVVENKPGAGGNIGTGSFVREKADGYALLMGTSSTNAINPTLYASLPFDPVKDFAPVIHIATVPNILVVPASSPFQSLDDLLQAARAAPGTLTYGSAGNGSSQHLAGSLLVQATGVDLLHVPYKGSGPAATDLMAGHLDLMLDTGSMPHIKSGTLRALAVAATERLPSLPDVPTFIELGLDGFQTAAWYGIMAPAGTPEAIVQRLNTELNTVLTAPDVITRLQDFGAVVEGGTAETFRDFTVTEIDRYGELVRASGAAID